MSSYTVRLPGRHGTITVTENIIDRAIRFVDPIRGQHRLHARMMGAIAGSYFGASRTRRGIKEWNPLAADADSTLLYELDILRARSRDLVRNSPLAGGAINTAVTNVVGTGLKLNARIDRSILNLTDERADEIERLIETEWSLFSETKEVDIERKLDIHALSDVAFRQVLENGDVLVNLPRIRRGFTPYTLRVQLIEADRLCNSNFAADTDKLIMGVEKDDNGATASYHVCNQFPIYSIIPSSKGLTWTILDAYSPSTGLPNVLHLFRQLRPGQSRGIPYLAPVIESLKKIDRYTDAELDAAVVSSFITVFVKTEAGEMNFDTSELGKETGAAIGDKDAKLAPGAMIDLAKGEDIVPFDPKRPNTSFDPFVLAILRQIGVALEIPFEILIKHFTASYSAARAALLEAWKFFLSRRAWLSTNMHQAIYEVWLYEAVALGRIPAPGFFADPLIRKAYSDAQWIGPARGMINEQTEVGAAKLRIDNHLSTHAAETAQLGGDWEKNLPQMRKEAAQLRDAGLSWSESASGAASPAAGITDSPADPGTPAPEDAANQLQDQQEAV